MRAKLPERSGFVDNGGVHIHYEVFGQGERTVLFMPTWAFVHSRFWKLQVPWLAREFRVITFDPRGNGRSDRPADPIRYRAADYATDACAVLDAVGCRSAVVVAHCEGTRYAIHLIDQSPERVDGLVAINTNLPLSAPFEYRMEFDFDAELEQDAGWATVNRNYWRRDFPGYVDFFSSEIASEPHSSRQLEDMRAWAEDTDAETLLCTMDAPDPTTVAEYEAMIAATRCPLLAIGGDADRISPWQRSQRLAEMTGGEFLKLPGSGHAPNARSPVAVNAAIKAFAERCAGRESVALTHEETPVRARQPDETGYVAQDGVRVYYEMFGSGSDTILLMPTVPFVEARMWKGQVAHLARHHRVITFDPRGNGKSDRPVAAEEYGDEVFTADALAVLDATATEKAIVVGFCSSVKWALLLATSHPTRVSGLVAVAPGVHPLSPPHPHFSTVPFEAPMVEGAEGWEKWNAEYWRAEWADFITFHSRVMSPEPHSSRVVEDADEWGLNVGAETMLLRAAAPLRPATESEAVELCASVQCPVLVLHGDQDNCQPIARGERFASLTGGRFVRLEGVGHLPMGREPVLVAALIREFADSVFGTARPAAPWVFARERTRRALYISSPIGLGHVLRDLAIAKALRAEVPDLQIEWLAQDPVTRVLEHAGEIIHPASAELASESAHWESEADEHGLHAFYAFRRMDEILCANYMLFDDVVRERPFDLWIGDESWEVDHFLHENPERKIAPFVFMTDFVGFLPVDPDRDAREVELTSDYNLELIEHRERFPSVRDRSIFIGAQAEIPDASFGPGLPSIREWSSKWYESVPYVIPFDPAAYRDPAKLRRELGYDEGGPLIAAAVGGTAVGRPLLELIALGFAQLRKEIPGARMVMVTGPRINPDDLPDITGLTKVGFLDNAFAHLAAADAAVVQGGLSTTMELVAARRPFVYFPIAQHFEQQHFVRHRLGYYRAGLPLDFASTTAPMLASALLNVMAAPVDYREVPADGASVVARRIAPLLVG